jgi:hypothetical protein
MTDLIAIAYRDTTTAAAAMDEVHRLESDLVIQANEVATISVVSGNLLIGILEDIYPNLFG